MILVMINLWQSVIIDDIRHYLAVCSSANSFIACYLGASERQYNPFYCLENRLYQLDFCVGKCSNDKFNQVEPKFLWHGNKRFVAS